MKKFLPLFAAAAMMSVAQLHAQDAPRRLGAIIVCTCDGSSPMTAFQVHEWWGTAMPRFKYQMSQSIDARIGCGEGTGCMVTDTVTGATAEEAVAIMRSRLNRSIRKKVSASVSGKRIVTGADGVQVLRIESADEPLASNNSSGGSNGGSSSSGGIQVSSADMSQFTQNASQGSMILYYGPGGAASQAYVYELRGPGLSDKKGVAGELAGKISAGSSFIGFEHRPGADCRTTEGYIKKKAGNSILVICSGTHNVK